MDACFLPATELARLVRRRELSPVEVTDAILDRIGAVNPRLNAFCAVDAEGARAAARDAEARLAREEGAGPLCGVPVSFKDLTPTAGIRTTWGSLLFEHHVPTADALPVARTRPRAASCSARPTRRSSAARAPPTTGCSA